MRHAFSILLALVLGAACAVLVACGGGGDAKSLIPASRASAMQDELERIARAARHGDCDAVSTNVADLQDQVNRLSNRVDAQLRRRLQEGVNNLATVAPKECMSQQADTQTTETAPTTTETTPTETTPDTTPTQTETVPPQTQTTPPTDQTPPPVETIPPSPGGATVPAEPGGGAGGSGGAGGGTGGAGPTP